MKRSTGAITISAIYLAFGLLWIFFSDMVLEMISPDLQFYAHAQTYKGWFYVLITTVLIFLLLNFYISNKNSAIDSLNIKELELKRELTEKELLLSEVHHRVKNNLQMLNSLIKLRSGSFDPENYQSSIDRITEQIQSLALIYEKVYQEKQPSGISLPSFIRDIAGDMLRSIAEPGKIDLKYNIAETTVNIEQAVPLGIILSEILSNSLKHAFQNNLRGIIKISFFSEDDNNQLIIEDNGSGFDIQSAKKGFGLELSRILADQLGGKIKLTSNPGETIFRLSFI